MQYGMNYRVAPLTEKPEEDDWYSLTTVGCWSVAVVRWYDSETGWDIPEAESGYTHYLKPVRSSILFTQEELEKIIGDAHTEGGNAMLKSVFIGSKDEILYSQTEIDRDKQQYIESLIKK